MADEQNGHAPAPKVPIAGISVTLFSDGSMQVALPNLPDGQMNEPLAWALLNRARMTLEDRIRGPQNRPLIERVGADFLLGRRNQG